MTGLGLASDLLQHTKDIAEIVKKYNDIPLYEKIIGLQGELVQAAAERLELATENTRLKEQLALRRSIRFANPYYFQEDDEVPLCPKCYESSNQTLRIHLTHPAKDNGVNIGRSCRNCSHRYSEGPTQKVKVQRYRRNYSY